MSILTMTGDEAERVWSRLCDHGKTWNDPLPDDGLALILERVFSMPLVRAIAITEGADGLARLVSHAIRDMESARRDLAERAAMAERN